MPVKLSRFQTTGYMYRCMYMRRNLFKMTIQYMYRRLYLYMRRNNCRRKVLYACDANAHTKVFFAGLHVVINLAV